MGYWARSLNALNLDRRRACFVSLPLSLHLHSSFPPSLFLLPTPSTPSPTSLSKFSQRKNGGCAKKFKLPTCCKEIAAFTP